jgi:YidC/Oxa1 family membrane protein insertase
VDLVNPNFILATLAGATQFVQTKMIIPRQKSGGGQRADFSKIMQKQMLYFFPVFTILILWKLPSAIGLYWAVTSIFTIFQQYLILRTKSNA